MNAATFTPPPVGKCSSTGENFLELLPLAYSLPCLVLYALTIVVSFRMPSSFYKLFAVGGVVVRNLEGLVLTHIR